MPKRIRLPLLFPLFLLPSLGLLLGCKTTGPLPQTCEKTASPPTVWVTTFAGSDEKGYADGPGGEAQFNKPSDIVMDTAGNLYVAEIFNHRIRKITPQGEVSTFAGSGEAGEEAGGYADGPGSLARFNAPVGIAIDAKGNLYVADALNHRIRKITPKGEVSTFAGSGETGEKAGGYADGPASAARFNVPHGLAFDAKGNLYVADAQNHCIRTITPRGEVSTFAGSCKKQGYADGMGSAAQFRWPAGIAIDAKGSLYVADDSHHIRKITPEGLVSTFAGSDEKGYADGPGAEAQLNEPAGMAMDKAGNLYVADSENHRIRKIEVRD